MGPRARSVALSALLLAAAGVIPRPSVSQEGAAGGDPAKGGPQVGAKAPEIRLDALFQAPEGAAGTLESLRGKVVVLEFWATWCGPCVKAIPRLNALAKELEGDAVQFISITDEEDEGLVRGFLAKRPIRGWVALDPDGSVSESYGAKAIPHTVVIDPQGNVAGVTRAEALTPRLIRDVLAGKGPKFPAGGEAQSDAGTGYEPLVSDDVPPLFRIAIQPSKGGVTASSANGKSMTLLGADAREVVLQAFGASEIGTVIDAKLPEGKFDLVAVYPNGQGERTAKMLRLAAEEAFGLRSRTEERRDIGYVIEAGPGLKLTPTTSTGGSNTSSGTGKIRIVGGTIGTLAGQLERQLRKPIMDRTGLEGRYDITLSWPADDDPALLEAIRKLGLEIERAEITRPILVIEGEEKGRAEE